MFPRLSLLAWVFIRETNSTVLQHTTTARESRKGIVGSSFLSSSLGPGAKRPSPPAIFLARPGGFLQFRLEAFPKFNISLRVHCTAQFENEREYLFLCRPGIFSRQKLLGGCKKGTRGETNFEINLLTSRRQFQIAKWSARCRIIFSPTGNSLPVFSKLLFTKGKTLSRKKEGWYCIRNHVVFIVIAIAVPFPVILLLLGAGLVFFSFFPETSRIVVAVDPANTQKILRRRLVFLLLCTLSFR